MADYRVLYTTLYFLFCFLRGSTIYYLVGYTILTHRLLEICLVSLNKNSKECSRANYTATRVEI